MARDTDPHLNANYATLLLPPVQLPQSTENALKRICANIPLMDDAFGDALDVRVEVPMSKVAEYAENINHSTDWSPEQVLSAFHGGKSGPPLTLFEICARIGSMDQLVYLEKKAQSSMSRLIYGGNATLLDLMKLLRAGACPAKKHLATRQDIFMPTQLTMPENGIEAAIRSLREDPVRSGTVLHWVCEAASMLPKEKAGHYGEVAHWLCCVAPVSLLSTDSRGRTPLEILMEAWKKDPSESGSVVDFGLLCGHCGTRGHAVRQCPDVNDCSRTKENASSSSPSLLLALARGLATVASRYPWKASKLLSQQESKFSAAVRSMRSILRGFTFVDGDRDEGMTTHAIGCVDDFLELECSIGELSKNKDIMDSMFSAAEQVASLKAVHDRLRLLRAVSDCAKDESEKTDAIETRVKLEMCEATHKAQVASLTERADLLEAELSAAQRQLEEAQTRNDALQAMSRQQACQGSAETPLSKMGDAKPPSSASHLKENQLLASTPQGLIAHLRRERLVDLDGLESTPPEVRSGIARMSQSLCAAVERLAEDLYESECHFIYELVQNAEDAHRRVYVKDASPSLHLRLFGPGHHLDCPCGYFISESNEAGFSESDVAAICDISASSKKIAKVDGLTIGCKGIGFKSVFTVSDRPHILSKDFAFVFDTLGPLGKLGYVTPTWLSAEDIVALPENVVASYRSGRTVLYLPLKKPSLVTSIEQEMLELSDPGRATLLFLKRLSHIELHSEQRMSRILSSQAGTVDAAKVIRIEGDKFASADHRYIIHKHAASDSNGNRPELVLAFPSQDDGLTAEDSSVRRLEPVFCSLPIRSLGFGFALHSDRFDLVANRADFHRSSNYNRCIRDSLPAAFSEACKAHPDIAANAIDLVGEPVADPFWRPAREGILQKLAGISCVCTEDGARKPTEVLLRGSGVLSEVAILLPPGLLLASCSKVFAEGVDATKDRLLRRLGTQEFSLEHLCACLSYKGEAWPDGWIASIWKNDKKRAVAPRLNTLYKALATVVLKRNGSADACKFEGGAIALDMVFEILKLPMLPLENGTCIAASDGTTFRGFCPELDTAAQQELAKASIISIVPDVVVKALDVSSCRLLDALGVLPPKPNDLAKAAVEVHLKFQLERRVISEDERAAIRTSIAILSEIWLSSGPGEQHEHVLLETFAQLGLADDKAQALASQDRCSDILSKIVLLCGRDGRLDGPQHLICPTLFGAESTLTPDIRAKIDRFLGFTAVTLKSHDSSMDLEFVDIGAWENLLELEAFLVDALKVIPLSPMDSRQPRVAPDLMLSLGSIIGNGKSAFWRGLMDHENTPKKVRHYVARRLQNKADAYWFGELPARLGVTNSMLRLSDLFLRSVFLPITGGALERNYLDLPEVETVTRSVETRRILKGLSVQCELDISGATSAIVALSSSGCRDAAAYAKLYAVINNLEEDEIAQNCIDSTTEVLLRTNIFHPDHRQVLRADQCIWNAPTGSLLPQCISQVSLRDVYKPFGEVKLERYFAARGVPTSMCSAQVFLSSLGMLLTAAEDLGRKWREASNPEKVMVSCGRAVVLADTFLAEVWQALLDIYKGMASLPLAEKIALRPFSANEARILVPLRCPEGGPPSDASMLMVAYFHDGAIFRKLSVGESFWEVAMDLAHSPAVDWAMTSFFPPELRNLFVEDFGVRAVVDRDALRASRRSVPQRPIGNSFGFGESRTHAVNASGLPDDLLGEDGGQGRKGILDSVVAALESLRKGGKRGRESTSSATVQQQALVAPAAPARSVRCPATRAKLLVYGGEISASDTSTSSRSKVVPVYVAEEEKVGRISESGEKTIRRAKKELPSLARLLWKLAEEVFEVPGSSVALLVDGSAQQDGCSHQSGNLLWPLIFSARLQTEVGDDPFFWFAEFSRALAHRSEGADHSTQHARVTQAIMARHHQKFCHIFSTDSAGHASLLSGKAKKRSVSRSRHRQRSRSRSRSKSRKRRRR